MSTVTIKAARVVVTTLVGSSLALTMLGCSHPQEGADKVASPSVKIGSVQDNTSSAATASDNEVHITAGEPFTIPDRYEMSVDSLEWLDELYPSDSYGVVFYYKDEPDSAYCVVRGTIKNLSSSASLLGEDALIGLGASYKLNGTYEYSARTTTDSGNDFVEELAPLETKPLVIFASIPNELRGTASLSVELTVRDERFDPSRQAWTHGDVTGHYIIDFPKEAH